MRAFVLIVLVVHGLIHFLGFAKAFRLAELSQLTEPVTRPMGLVWLAAGLLMLVCVFIPPRAFWVVAASAALLSQIAIISAWHDAKFGTLANLVVLLAAAYAFFSEGPLSAARAYEQGAARALANAEAADSGVVSEADLLLLPAPVQRYLRVTGSVGRPRIASFRVRWRGRIRGTAGDPWLPFTAQQTSTVRPAQTRLFFMRAKMKGLPVAVLHRFVDERATFQARLLSMFPIVKAAGPEMDRSETVTILNDLCLLAPSALLEPSMQWQPVDDTTARVRFTRGAQTVSAELHFNPAGELIDFVSDDRFRASADGQRFMQLRWSTPFTQYRRVAGGLRIFARGQARWHEDSGSYAYGEFEVQDIAYNVSQPAPERLAARGGVGTLPAPL